MIKNELKDAIERLDAFLLKKQTAAARLDPAYGALIGQLQQLVARGGKRLRPRLLFASYAVYGGAQAQISSVAAAMELLHAGLLMHDDVIDEDTVRWGNANIAGVYLSQGEHYAQSVAILAGTLCQTYARELVVEAGFKPEPTVHALSLFESALATTIAGQLLDMNAALPSSELDEAGILAIGATKTGGYSFTLPLQFGAVFAGADKQDLALLARLGQELGIAFQLQDDIIGLFGDAATTGKPDLSDLQAGKQTLLALYTRQLATPDKLAQFNKYYGQASASHEDMAKVRQIVGTCGAQAKVAALADEYYLRARTTMERLSINAAGLKTLREITDGLAGRQL